MPKKKSPGTLAENRKARHDYNIEDTIEAGIVLQGTEIKSIRRGSANLKDNMCFLKKRCNRYSLPESTFNIIQGAFLDSTGVP